MRFDFTSLRKSLLYLHVEELRSLACRLSLVEQGNKITLINRIIHFLETGVRLKAPSFPKASCAEKGKVYRIEPNAVMLKGAYKNDLQTRLFFKQLIGEHFHFTAFGIDWLNERWMEGNPPTYQEFAQMWKVEYAKREKNPAAPKEEWAYINFVQDYLKQAPNSPREQVHAAWEQERQKHLKFVQESIEEHYE